MKSTIIFLLSVFVEISFACNGYKLKINKIENCAGDNQIVTIDEGFSMKLNKKCELVPSGCITHKAFNTALETFKITKDGVVVKEGTVDVCDAATHAQGEHKNMMKMFSLPEKCPVSDGKVCSDDRKLDFSKFKNMLSLARGQIDIESNIDHDTGKSCFKIAMEITK
ncbi:uncharacterized protein LOC129608540 [Condylostylus longicornis]|uniref:uncharacterized protein LOC129608540 n=1 Tax=Condylostylus longicornis TaxID=2530218 RepID=UPI00244E31B2|nr:uncharacterized protein LOC129608540 [Condylostylus longicornis]